MAEVDTVMLSQEHSDIRREQAEQASNIRREAGVNTNEIVKEGLKESFNIRGDVKDARHDIEGLIGNQTDRVVDRVEEGKDALLARTWDLGRESADNRAQILALSFQVRDGFVATAKDSEINALKTQIETAKQTTYLSDKIDGQAEKTRELISELKNADLNRMLIERNAALVEERHAHHHWRHNADMAGVQGQWAALNSQLQAFQSQLASSSQGMVNFGTQAGVGQTSSANQVR